MKNLLLKNHLLWILFSHLYLLDAENSLCIKIGKKLQRIAIFKDD